MFFENICKGRENMTLRQQALNVITDLSDEDLSQVIQFVNFLHFSKMQQSSKTQKPIKGKKYRTRGGLSGKVVLAEDFYETPDCFKEYM